MIAALLVMGFLSSLFGCSKRDAPQPPLQKFTDLSHEDFARLERQRSVVATAVHQRYGTAALTKTKADIPVLQRLIDDRAFSEAQTYELQCLGVAFGDVLASELPVRWVMVTDEYGIDPTLRYKDSTIQLNALTMISKRVEKGEQVDLTAMLHITGEELAHMESELQK